MARRPKRVRAADQVPVRIRPATGPDATLHYAPTTFDTREDAEAWLVDERRKISEGRWTPPTTARSAAPRVLTFGEYTERWMTRRDLKPRTAEHYRSLLDRHILPTFSTVPLRDITSEAIPTGGPEDGTAPPSAATLRLLRTILGTAVTDEKITASPCHPRAEPPNGPQDQARHTARLETIHRPHAASTSPWSCCAGAAWFGRSVCAAKTWTTNAVIGSAAASAPTARGRRHRNPTPARDVASRPPRADAPHRDALPARGPDAPCSRP